MASVFADRYNQRKASTGGTACVAVCVPTFRRPEGLKRLLDSLQRLSFVKAPEPQVLIVIADNDPGGSVSFKAFATESGIRWPLKIEIEPRRGVSFARNAAVKTAIKSGAEWIAFIDDDEIPEPSWLDELLNVQKQFSADLVAGPVLPEYEEGTPAWVIKGGFFDRPRLKTGTILSLTRTGNLLVSVSCFNDGSPFDSDFSKSGGEDTLFTLQLAKEGRKIVWADEAVVRELVPLERGNVRYILSNAYAGGSSWARVEYVLQPRAATRVLRAAKGSIQLLCGIVSLLPSALVGRHAAVRSASRIWLGAGEISGGLGQKAGKYGVDG